MTMLARIFLCLIILNLIGCHRPIEVVKYQATCKLACLKKLDFCNLNCHDNCYSCSTCSKKATANSHKQYIHEQLVQGGFLVRQLNSYRDPLKCRKPTCECRADYRVCTQSCEGIIHKRLQIPPVCC